MTITTRLIVGNAYYLRGMTGDMWTTGHPEYGTPDELAGRYLGSLRGTRVWHGFEIWVSGKEVGVIFMTTADLEQLSVVRLVR
jgi:hypothetical protein